MTSKQFDVLSAYIGKLQASLGLEDWKLKLSENPPEDEDAQAMVLPLEGRKHATIYVCSDFAERDPNSQRQAVVHELLHLHHIAATDIIRLDLWESRCLPQSTYDLMFLAFKRQMEYAVDGIDDAIAHHFPLIEWDMSA